jgi:putative tricarboxylic transport membrane protein
MIKSKKDLYAGLMFIIIGAFFALWALNYPMGSSVRMGPAYFPTILGWLTAGLGVIIFIRGLTIPDVEPNPIKWHPLLLINGAAVVFGLLVDPLKIGFVGAVVVSVIVCAFGGYEFKWKEAIIEAVVLVIVCWAAFVWGLGLPFRLFPWDH